MTRCTITGAEDILQRAWCRGCLTITYFKVLQMFLKTSSGSLIGLSTNNKKIKEIEVRLIENNRALKEDLEANNSTLSRVAAKVEDEREKLIRLEAQLSEKSEICRRLEVKSKKQKKINNKLATNLKETQEKVERLNLQFLAREDTRRLQQQEFELQMQLMTDKYREMQLGMQAAQIELNELKKQVTDQQITNSLIKLPAIAKICGIRGEVWNFPSAQQELELIN